MPKFQVGLIITSLISDMVIASCDIVIEADTQEEAEALAIASTCLLNSASAEWSIDYCDELDEDEDEDDDDESKEELLTFCASAGIEGIDEDSSIEEMIAELKTYEFESSELSSDETEVLKKHGLSSIIKQPHKTVKARGSKK